MTNNFNIHSLHFSSYLTEMFMQGCDASILLKDSSSSLTIEGSSEKNFGLRKFDLIHNIKSSLGEVCPHTVSLCWYHSVGCKGGYISGNLIYLFINLFFLDLELIKFDFWRHQIVMIINLSLTQNLYLFFNILRRLDEHASNSIRFNCWNRSLFLHAFQGKIIELCQGYCSQ